MPSRKASALHDPPIPLLHRWRCCRTHCARPNTHTSSTHFVPHFSPRENHIVRAPGYYGQNCAACRHPACDECCFLEVRRVDGRSAASETGERSPWDSIGYWDRREEFMMGDVVGLRQMDELPPRTKKELGEAWRRNGRWDL